MRISEVNIRKFRSIKEAYFKLNDVTAIVGENNAGKTGVLRALNSVFNFESEREYFLDKTHQYAKRNNSYIRLKLGDVPSEDIYFHDFIFNNSLTIELMYSYSENRRKMSVLKGSQKENIQNVDAFMEKLNNHLTYVYIPAERTNIDISWGEKTIFKRLVTSYLNRYTKNRDMISSDIKRSSKKIHDSVLCRLEKSLSQLYMQNKDVDFRIDFPNDIDYSSILDLLQFSIEEADSNHLLKEWGSGTKSLAIIAMHRAYALIEEKNIILGIEEPETNLHPQAQKRFIQSLSTNMSKFEVQMIFTTHSTVLVDELKHENILLVKRKEDSDRPFVSVVKQLAEDFWEKHDIKESAHYNFFRLKNSEFFFAKHVVLCESPIDAYVMEQLLLPHIKKEIADISFLDIGGVNNLAYPYFLLKELSIPFSVVVDYDFFFDYKNQKIENSRNKNGFPEYKNIITDIDSKKKILEDVFGKNIIKMEEDRGYRKFFDLIKPFNFYSMRYCLEIDLVCSSKAKELYYNILKLKDDQRQTKVLLVDNYKALKKRENILKVIDKLEPRSYPESFIKIRNAIIEDIRAK